MKAISYCNKIIRYSFYALFLFVPLIFFGNTSELFEFNKMWLTFGLTIIIGAAWISKMIIERKIILKRTPLDIPLIIFLISQTISTVFSLDSHVSFWGYYTRFNGGLLSIITYLFLYYAFVSNLQPKHVKRVLSISLLSGFITVIWGLPSRFGYDPTCLVFRGSLDTNCWTDAFKPTVRVFSTLGQPAWFAAYLNVLLPLSIIYFLLAAPRRSIAKVGFLLLASLFYVSLIFTNTRAGTAAFYISDIILWIILFYKKFYEPKKLLKYFLILHFAFAILNFFYGAPINALDKFTFPQLQKNLVAHAQTPTAKSLSANQSGTRPANLERSGITDSGVIRLFVWQGAIDAWKAYPIFGTGVETFAFAYYRYRPPGHNMTSEWDYLYNKAHNEYLNYLTTTGIFGLGTYLLFIGFFIFLTGKILINNNLTMRRFAEASPFGKKQFNNEHHYIEQHKNKLLVLGMFGGWLSILITNFFGFSVVIINLYFFLIPAFFFMIANPPNTADKKIYHPVNLFQWMMIIATIGIAITMSYQLFRYWYADTAYAYGNNLDKVSSYQQAYPYLENAVNTVPNEPVYKDELAVNLATLAQAFFLQNDASIGAQLAERAISLDNQVIENHPNNIIFWKNRLRILYSLGTSDRQNEAKYLDEAIRVLIKASELAPTDPKISYNLGILMGQTGNLREGIQTMEKTIRLKPDYRDAYIALGLYYHQLALGKTSAADLQSDKETIKDPQMQKKAIDTYQFLMDNFTQNDNQIKDTIEKWKGQK